MRPVLPFVTKRSSPLPSFDFPLTWFELGEGAGVLEFHDAWTAPAPPVELHLTYEGLNLYAQ